MSELRPAPQSLALATAAAALAVLELAIVAVYGNAVRAEITDPSLRQVCDVVLAVFLLAGAIILWRAVKACRYSLRARREASENQVLAARSSAQESRDISLSTYGLASALFIIFCLWQFLMMNDGRIQQTFLRWDFMRASMYDILRAFTLNVRLAIIAEVLVLALGLVLAVARLAPGRAGAPVRAMAVAYVDLFRAVPAIIVIYLIGFGLPLAKVPLLSGISAEWFAILALTFAHSAYVAEMYRAGIQSIHPSQWSAGRSLGFTYMQTLQHFILPQAVRIVIPPLLGAFVALQKDTALVSVVGTLDAFNQAKFYASMNFNLSSVTIVAILFVVITIPQTRLVDWMLARSAQKRK